jgi:hypothetical protein
MMGECRDTHGVVSGLSRNAGGHVDPALMMANHQLEEQDFVGSPDEDGDPVAQYGAVLESVVRTRPGKPACCGRTSAQTISPP